MEEIKASHNPDQSRYEIHVDGALAGVIDYKEQDGVRDMFHTGVEKEFGGRGLGGRIVEFALTDSRDAGLQVRPTCPFIARFFDQHPDFADLRA